MSNTHLPEDEKVVEFLVGSLPPDEADRLDELSISDDDFAARISAVEHDLVDAYVNGELSGDRLDRFRARYLQSSISREKVKFATMLHRYHDRPARPMTRSLDWRLAAAAVVVLALGGYLLMQNLNLQKELADTRAQLTTTQGTREKPQVPVAASPVIAAFVLMPATRGPASLPTVTIRRATDVVALVLAEADDFPAYEAVLKNAATDEVIWRQASLSASSTAGTRSVSISLPATLLKAQTYTIELTGVPSSGDKEVINSYAFSIKLE